MERIFLSFAFRPEDRDLVRQVENLMASHGLRTITGEDVGGGILTSQIMSRIEECDGLVALLTRRDLLPNGRYSTHQWVLDELNHARGRTKLALALIDIAVDAGGAYQEHERVDLDPANPAPALLKLARTIGIWKRQAGRQLKVRILPEELGRRFATDGQVGATCEYRLYRDGQASDWRAARVVPELGGSFAYLTGVADDSLIQIRIQVGRQNWISEAVPQWVQIQVKKAR